MPTQLTPILRWEEATILSSCIFRELFYQFSMEESEKPSLFSLPNLSWKPSQDEISSVSVQGSRSTWCNSRDRSQAETEKETGREGGWMERWRQAPSRANMCIMKGRKLEKRKERFALFIHSFIQGLLYYSLQPYEQHKALVLTEVTLRCRKTASIQIRKEENVGIRGY